MVLPMIIRLLFLENSRYKREYEWYSDVDENGNFGLRHMKCGKITTVEDMQVMYHSKTLGVIEIDPIVWKRLTEAEIKHVLDVCDVKLAEYYARI